MKNVFKWFMPFLRKFTPVVTWGKTTLKGFLDNNASMHAAGLTYFSMLAIVPILCLLLLVARGLKAEQYVRAQIDEQIELAIANIEKGQDDDLASAIVVDQDKLEARRQVAQEFGQQARDLSNKLFSKIEQFDISTLGWIGFLLLLWTVISSMSMVEVSFNELWEVSKPRPIWKRAYLYLSIAIVLPVLGALAMSIPVLNVIKDLIVAIFGAMWLTQWVSTGLIALLDSMAFRLAVALFFSSLAFAFIFCVVPNCVVRFKYAWWGGLITAALFAGWIKVCAIAQVGIANSSALYGSFALLPILLAWLYMSWQIILLGASMTRAFDRVCMSQGIPLERI